MIVMSVLSLSVLVAVVLLTCVSDKSVFAISLPYHILSVRADVYILPILPFDYDNLEPYMTRETIVAHYEGHHESYRKKMNAVLNAWREDVRITFHSL